MCALHQSTDSSRPSLVSRLKMLQQRMNEQYQMISSSGYETDLPNQQPHNQAKYHTQQAAQSNSLSRTQVKSRDQNVSKPQSQTKPKSPAGVRPKSIGKGDPVKAAHYDSRLTTKNRTLECMTGNSESKMQSKDLVGYTLQQIRRHLGEEKFQKQNQNKIAKQISQIEHRLGGVLQAIDAAQRQLKSIKTTYPY